MADGIAPALASSGEGYELVLMTLPQGMSRERAAPARQYGARVELVESMGGMSEAVAVARGLACEPDVFLPDQFSNPANPEVHRRTTGLQRSSRRSMDRSTRWSPGRHR